MPLSKWRMITSSSVGRIRGNTRHVLRMVTNPVGSAKISIWTSPEPVTSVLFRPLSGNSKYFLPKGGVSLSAGHLPFQSPAWKKAAHSRLAEVLPGPTRFTVSEETQAREPNTTIIERCDQEKSPCSLLSGGKWWLLLDSSGRHLLRFGLCK